MKRLLPVLLLVACTPLAYLPHITMTVESQHWSARAVRVYCDSNAQLGVLRGVVLNAKRTRRIYLSGCDRIYLTVDVIGTRHAWTAPDYILVQPGDSLQVTIGPQLSLTTWRVRQ